MVQQRLPSPRITDCCWGRVSIDGHGAVKDAKLYPGGARAWDWRETGTRHGPGIQPRRHLPDPRCRPTEPARPERTDYGVPFSVG